MLTGLYEMLPRRRLLDCEVLAGDGLQFTQIVNVPYLWPLAGEDKSLQQKREEARVQAFRAIEWILWAGRLRKEESVGAVHRFSDGLLAIQERIPVNLLRVSVGELRPLQHIDLAGVPDEYAGRWLWEGALVVPPTEEALRKFGADMVKAGWGDVHLGRSALGG